VRGVGGSELKNIEEDWALDFEIGGTNKLVVVKDKICAHLKKN